MSGSQILKIVLADHDRLAFEDAAVAGSLICTLEEFSNEQLSLSDTSNLVYFQWENIERRGQIFHDCTLKSARMCVARFSELRSRLNRLNSGSLEEPAGTDSKQVRMCMERDVYDFIAVRTGHREFEKQCLDERSISLHRTPRVTVSLSSNFSLQKRSVLRSASRTHPVESPRDLRTQNSRDIQPDTMESFDSIDLTKNFPATTFSRSSLYNNLQEAERMEQALMSTINGAILDMELPELYSEKLKAIPHPRTVQKDKSFGALSIESVESDGSFVKLPSEEIHFLMREPSKGARLAELRKESADIDQFEQKIFDNLANLQRQLGLQNFNDSEAQIVEQNLESGLSELEQKANKMRQESLKDFHEVSIDFDALDGLEEAVE